jgi:hypothetical protein
VVKEPTGTATTFNYGRSALIFSVAALIVHPFSSGHSVLAVASAQHPLLSADEFIFFRDTCRSIFCTFIKHGNESQEVESRNEVNENCSLHFSCFFILQMRMTNEKAGKLRKQKRRRLEGESTSPLM